MLHFDPIEVIEVISDESDNVDLSSIIGRYVLDEQGGEDLRMFKPLNQNMLQLPIRGEVVLGTSFGGRYYYMSNFNFTNSPVSNSLPNISYYTSPPLEDFRFGKYFEPSISGSKKLESREGETIIQGRFGNSIRLGSNQVQDLIENNNEKVYTESPNIKLVSGIKDIGDDINLTYKESLDTEINSIYMTTKEDINFKFKGNDIKNFQEPQITIQSDNIVFHGREKFNVFADNINLGSDNTQPVVLGNELVDLLNDTLLTLTNIITAYSPANPTSTPSLQREVSNLSEKINNILSSKVNTE